jgi:hypothetical protein
MFKSSHREAPGTIKGDQNQNAGGSGRAERTASKPFQLLGEKAEYLLYEPLLEGILPKS